VSRTRRARHTGAADDERQDVAGARAERHPNSDFDVRCATVVPPDYASGCESGRARTVPTLDVRAIEAAIQRDRVIMVGGGTVVSRERDVQPVL